MALTSVQRRVKEGASAVYKATIRDEDKAAIPLASLVEITLTLYNDSDGAIINSRDDQNVKNTNDVTIHATSGLLTWVVQPEDNAIVGSTSENEYEKHRALFAWRSNPDGAGGAASLNRYGKHEAIIEVLNLGKVS